MDGLAPVLTIAGTGLGMTGLALLIRLRSSTRPVHGSARWASARELRQAGLYGRTGLIAGQLGRQWLRVPPKQHTLIIAPTQGRKSTLLINDLVTWGGSALIGDPKGGELHAHTASWRETIGPVWRFAPATNASCCINLWDRVRIGTMDEWDDASAIAHPMLAPRSVTVHESEASQYFRRQGIALLTAGIIGGKRRALQKSFAGLLHGMSNREAMLRLLATDANEQVRDVAKMVGGMADREQSAVWNTVLSVLDIYRSPTVAYHTNASDVPWWGLTHGPSPASLYLVTDSMDDLSRLYPLFRAVIGAITSDVSRPSLLPEDQRRWQLQMMVDELPAWGYMDVFERGIAQLAGFGVSCVLAAQDLGQLWTTYGEHTAIWGNTAVKVFHTPASDETARRLSRMLDEETVQVSVRHRGGRSGRSVTEQVTGRPLMTMSELLEMDPSRALVFAKGVPPALAWQVYWKESRRLRGRVTG